MSWTVSSNNLCEETARSWPNAARRLLRVAWHTVQTKCEQLSDFLRRETNKPLPKELRRSLRLNKSAKRKGYQQYQSETDKRCLDEFLNRPINISIRVGPAYEYRPSNV